jgi:hypothetical protein
MSATPLVPRGFLNIFRAAPTLSKAWDSAGMGRWEEARSSVHRLADLLGAPIPDPRYDLDINILKLQIDYFTSSELEAKITAEICARQSAIVRSSPANCHMKQYLQKLLNGCGGRFPESEEYFDALAASIKIGTFNEKRVAMSLKYRMPLRHPARVVTQ